MGWGIFNLLADVLFPSYCAVCGKVLIGKDNYAVACRDCWNEHFKAYKGVKCLICGHPVEKLPGSGNLCKRCLESGRRFYFEGVDFFGIYEGLIEYAIYELKFEKNLPVAKFIGREIGRHLRSSAMKNRVDVITFVPVSEERKRERGYDQCEEILKATGIKFESLLEKTFETERQATLEFSKRRENVKGCFRVNRNVKGKRVLLFDDVFTTGATANEAAKTLKEAGAERVFVFTVAYTVLGK